MTDAQPAIRVNHVTKSFRVHLERNQTLKEKILYAGRAKYRDFVALRDVSVDIMPGESVGLIGVNGSGKSTLLKLMSRILYPDVGTIEVAGRVSSLLELGAGFHPDFSGRENIFMNGALLGLSRREISYKIGEIIEFSELGDFIDEPVRSYSSGMYMRLAFSVAVAVDPEILLIDEILAVGDAAFQAKCMSRLKELRGQDKTIVIVTHDASAVERFCDKVVWMHNSRVRMEGQPVECIQTYLATVFRAANEGANTMSFDRTGAHPDHTNSSSLADEATGEERVDTDPMDLRWGTGDVVIDRITVTSSMGEGLVKCGDPLDITMHFHVVRSVQDVDFGVGIFSEEGTQCYGTNTRVDRHQTISLEVGTGHVTFRADNFCLLPGTYAIDVACSAADTQAHDYWRKASKVQVFSDRPDVGICRIPHDWELIRDTASIEFARM